MSKYRIFTIKFNKKDECFDESELNDFCLNKKIIDKRIEFFQTEGKVYWSVFIEYETILPEKQFSKEFNEAEKIFIQKLREWRKEEAEKLGIPVYLISTNKQIEELVVKKPKTKEELKKINGFGKKKISKYGDTLIEIIKNYWDGNE
jgi:superfamily II DNA helicase RecQ